MSSLDYSNGLGLPKNTVPLISEAYQCNCNWLLGTPQANGMARMLARRCLIKLGDDVIE